MQKIHDKWNVKILNKNRIVCRSCLIRREFKKFLSKMFIIITSHTPPLRYQKSMNRLQEISAHPGAQVPRVRDTATPTTVLHFNLLLNSPSPNRMKNQLEKAKVRILPGTKSLSWPQKVNINNQETNSVFYTNEKNETQGDKFQKWILSCKVLGSQKTSVYCSWMPKK